MKHKNLAATLVVAAVVILLMTGCGSSSSSDTSAASSAPSATQAASSPSGKAIVLGSICSCSGPGTSLLADQQLAAKAWASYVNSHGGINGHPVRMITMDDGANPATGLQQVKTLIEHDHVLAIVGDSSLVDVNWAGYASKRGVPVIGGLTVEGPFVTDPNFFPSGTQFPVLTLGTLSLAKKAGKSHYGVLYCAESPICAQLDPLAKGISEKLLGAKYSSAKIAATAPSYAAPCLAMKSAGVDAVFVAAASPVVARFIDACAQQGFKPLHVNQTTTTADSWLKDPNLTGTLLAGPNANPFDASIPAVKTFRDALDAEQPGAVDGSGFSYDTLFPWVSGQLFAAAAKAAHITPDSTSADVKDGLYQLKNETLSGLAPPLTFKRGQPTFVPCYFTVSVKSKFDSLSHNAPVCLTATQAKALAAALG
jgi:branched-chain amino acid transport system substrate-binding protein